MYSMTKRLLSHHKLAAFVWGLIVLALAGFSYRGLSVEERIQFDILAMLPSSHSASIAEVRTLMDKSKITQQNLIFFGHPDPKESKQALHKFRRHLASHAVPMKENSVKALTESYHTLFKNLFPYRARLLAQEDRQHLISRNHDYLLQTALAEIVGLFTPANVKQDPFSFFSHYVKGNQFPSPFQIDRDGDVYILSSGITWHVYTGTLKESAFSMDVQDLLSQNVIPFLNDLQAQGIKILKMGGIFYATAGANQARHEISLIGFISTVGIILMMLVIFRSLRPLVFATLVIATAIVTGFAACLVIFGSVHILAIVIGCTLVGITVDYALHYTCASYTPHLNGGGNNSAGFKVLKKLMPALPLSVLSSAAGYGLLLFIPFPGIQQMALLSCLGLLTAFVSVCLWGPYVINPESKPIPSVSRHIQDLLEKIAILGTLKHCRSILALMLMGLFGLGLLCLSFEDNVRSFQALNPALKLEEDQIKAMIDLDASSKFLTVRGNSVQDVLEREEEVMEKLEDLKISYRCLASLIPSQKRQQENYKYLEDFYQSHLKSLDQHLGQDLITSMDHLGLDAHLLDLDPKILPMGWKELIHISESGSVVGRIMITQPCDGSLLHTIAAQFEDVRYINAAQEYSLLFQTYRLAVSGLILLVLGGIFILLAVKTGVNSACHVVTPVILSLGATLGILAMSMSLNLFHAMGLLLVLCIGIDYALFLFWRTPCQEHQGELLLLGNGLAAVTTILSFGLLAFSQTTAVYSFGLSVFIGIFLCFMVTTLFLGRASHEK